MKISRSFLISICFTFLIFSIFGCKKKENAVIDLKEEIPVSASKYDFYYFTDGGFKKVKKVSEVPVVPNRPWTEAVRISGISSAASVTEADEAVPEGKTAVPSAYGVVNRVGILSFNSDKITLSADTQLFNGRTAGNLVFYEDTPVYSLFRSTFFNDMERNFHGVHPFLVQFNPEQRVSYQIVGVENLGLSTDSEITDFIWDGNIFLCSAKKTEGDKISFSYLNFQEKENLLLITPESAGKDVFITKSTAEDFRKAQKIRDFKDAPSRIRELLSPLAKEADGAASGGKEKDFPRFMITVRTAGGHSPRRYATFAEVSGDSRYADATSILSDTWCAALFQDGTIFIKGALPGRNIFNRGRSVALRLPKLPENFSYTGFAVTGDYLYASWEETDFYCTARSGFLSVNLGKILY